MNKKDEARARDLRIELEQLTAAESAVAGLALIDPGEHLRLAQLREAKQERFSELTALEAKAR